MTPVTQLPRRSRTRVEFERFVGGCAGDLLLNIEGALR